jgi:Rv0078B-related antitoxin
MKSAHGAFRTTLDLFSAGLESMRQNLRRDQPKASESEIDRRLEEWLQKRPGDSPGRLVDIDARIG